MVGSRGRWRGDRRGAGCGPIWPSALQPMKGMVEDFCAGFCPEVGRETNNANALAQARELRWKRDGRRCMAETFGVLRLRFAEGAKLRSG